ncbi:hypothetical protein MATR_21660 [Marivirga tractuosa]|uniref:Uncharacterized protein n=1 Tax=Marivirga tractuosa (strain ATCC 23168 / DSM 4126 / NBRC 15989 / NCIMB 1408 / VKM B-1430 / H-43) TaxID=643867 RepID=E4TL80_MARTH|nr:hypothetical protein Ftrac_0207 [Marivirga tractuosa DSM 4126]BDD15341.1 hypothetical protein MATR_21660 [Marivirga tractuosa]
MLDKHYFHKYCYNIKHESMLFVSVFKHLIDQLSEFFDKGSDYNLLIGISR